MPAWQLSRAAGVGREVVHRLVGPVLGSLVGGPRILGREWLAELPAPSLICPNHQSHLDIPVLRRSLGSHGRWRLAIAAADDYWFQRRSYRLVVSWFAAIPFRRIGSGAGSIHAVESLLADGWRVVIFPEGTRSRTGDVGPFKPGAALIAVQTGVPVVPVRIDGLWAILPPGSWRPRRGRATVRFGEPLRAAPGESARAFTARLEAAVRGLGPIST
ncbi:MAG: 1-acyl-sn-glycerol-3-phosphate acyltransferase [Chloroflexota bacterium]|jgi:1-acyl-sn-glycerol-3-phosphate acyltransferase|nr:1-acyl-sn-glycerol-3-phosphate acyltransferase [Chloroflexota bacterium]MDH5242462.1 1-acyl-sn-glycerol-3-phosphate acyltransferase [Chloroflexota bacterium]